MKHVLKEWVKCPKAVLFTLIDICCSVTGTYLNTITVLLITEAINDWNNINSYIPKIAILAAIEMVCDIISSIAYRVAGHHSFTELHNRFTTKIQRMKYNKFVKYSPDYITTITERLGYIRDGIDVLNVIITSICKIAVLIFAIYNIDSMVAVPILAVYCIGVVISYACHKYYRKCKSKLLTVKKDRNKELMETINAFAEVRANNMQNSHIESIINKNISIMNKQLNVEKSLFIVVTALNGMDFLGFMTVILTAYTSITVRGITPTSVIALVMYVWRLVAPISHIINVLPRWAEISAGIPELIEIFEVEEEEDGNINLISFDNKIEFRNVSFCYNDESDTVLSNINLVINKGEKVGICGVSGSGKTTLIKLLSGFYRDYTGSILVDGIELRDLKIASLRNKMGIVHQDNYIFNESAFDNIKYSCPDANEYDVVEAAKKAAIYDFIQSLPQKFNTNVGPKGMKLSGGQKQRIALARIFLKNPDIVLLDEATSALDNEAENTIQKAIDNLQDKTVITIAHRLTTIMNCDKIVVIDNHKIVEEGNHNSLMSYNTIYRRLWQASQKA